MKIIAYNNISLLSNILLSFTCFIFLKRTTKLLDTLKELTFVHPILMHFTFPTGTNSEQKKIIRPWKIYGNHRHVA